MYLILLAGQLINPAYISRIKAVDKDPIEVIPSPGVVQDRKYIVHLDGGEEIMIGYSELARLWRYFGERNG